VSLSRRQVGCLQMQTKPVLWADLMASITTNNVQQQTVCVDQYLTAGGFEVETLILYQT